MAKPERYRSFDEMENAQQNQGGIEPNPKKKGPNTMKDFVELLKEKASLVPKQKKSCKS